MTRIGFIGVGTMGLPMAKNLVKKGFTVTAFDSNPEAVKAAAAAGMTAAASAAEAVATADIVVTMLPSSPHVEAVYTGDGGVLAAARKGTLCVDMSTIDPAVSQRVAKAAQERGVRFIQLYAGGAHNDDNWDAHGDLVKNHTYHAGRTDQPIAALIKDLKQHGLLDSTLIVMAGEFGRTPKVSRLPQYYKLPGRDHWGAVQTVFFAGGGVKGGTVIGASDKNGGYPAEAKFWTGPRSRSRRSSRR